jgi:hypothetical protein
VGDGVEEGEARPRARQAGEGRSTQTGITSQQHSLDNGLHPLGDLRVMDESRFQMLISGVDILHSHHLSVITNMIRRETDRER